MRDVEVHTGARLVTVGAGAFPGMRGALGLVAGAAVSAHRMCEDELGARRVAHRAILASIDVLGLVAFRALRSRHVVAPRTRHGLVTGQVGLAAIDHRRLGRVEGGLGEVVVDSRFFQRAYADVMTNSRVAHDAFTAIGVLGMREAGGGQRDIGVATLAALAGDRRDLLHGKLGIARHVGGDLL